MSECGLLTDRIPGVLRGQSEWTAAELGHLNSCRACRRELELVRATARLGEDLEQRVDSDAVSESVLRRLRHAREGQRRSRRWTVAGLLTAAAIVGAVWTGALKEPAQPRPSLATGELAIPLPELESLQAAELDSVLQTMDEPNLGAMEALDLRDLSADELERVLESWEG